MILTVVIILVIMVIFSFLAAAEEEKGSRDKEDAAQGVVSTGWIVLTTIAIIFIARGC